MSGGLQPGRLEPPLPGGLAGAQAKVRGLLTGTMGGPRGWFFREGGITAPLRALGVTGRGPLHRFPVGALLVEHPGAGPLLLDTGFSAGALQAPVRHLGWVGTRVFREARGSDAGTAARQLQELQVDPALIVMTHLHWDHASALADFPKAHVLVSHEEWAAAHRPAANMSGYLRRHLRACGKVSLIDFADGSSEPWESFRQTIDLFGDGSIRLVSTPGHSPGHLSMLLRLREGLALLAGDALYTMRTLHEHHHPWQLGAARAYGESFASIEMFARTHPDALVLPGHDLQAWQESGIEEGL